MKRILIAILTALTLFSAALAEPAPLAEPASEKMTPSGIPYDEIQSRIDAYIAERKAGLASCAVSVYDADGVRFTRCYGYADIESGVRADEETVYEWGSNSKLLVWVSAMQLWERGLLDLEADIRDYLPEGFLTKLRYPDETITMLNLMAHNAGFQESFYENQEARPDEVYDSLEDALRACECHQAYHVGQFTAYSNWSTALAAYIVGRASGTDYVTYVHEHILAPLGMAHTSVDANMADNDWVRQRRAQLKCYSRYAEARYNEDYGPSMYGIQLFPAGAATGTIGDFARFGQALVARNCPLFESAATRDKMFAPLTCYGDTGIAKNCHGFWTSEHKVQTLGHGGNTMCTANIEFDPASGLGIVVMANEPGETAFCSGLPGLLFGEITDRAEYQSAPFAGNPDIGGVYQMKRTIARGAGKASGYMGGLLSWSGNGDGTYSMRLFGMSFGSATLIPIAQNQYVMRDNGMDTFIYDNRGVLEMMSTDLVKISHFWIVLCYGFIFFGLACIATLLVKLVACVVRKIRRTGKKYAFADRQILAQQLVYGVSGVIFALFIMIVGSYSRAFTTVSAILAALLGLASLVNGGLLCYNTISADVKKRAKAKRFIWAALGIAYAAFIVVMQLYNFWNL